MEKDELVAILAEIRKTAEDRANAASRDLEAFKKEAEARNETLTKSFQTEIARLTNALEKAQEANTAVRECGELRAFELIGKALADKSNSDLIGKMSNGQHQRNSIDISSLEKSLNGRSLGHALVKGVTSSDLDSDGKMGTYVSKDARALPESSVDELLATIFSYDIKESLTDTFVRELLYRPVQTTATVDAENGDSSVVVESAAGMVVDSLNRIKFGTNATEYTITAIEDHASGKKISVSPSLAANVDVGAVAYLKYVGPVGEGEQKPDGYYKTETVSNAVVTIPTILAVSRIAFRSLTYVRNQILQKLPRRLRVSLLRQILYGIGGEELTGIYGTTGVQTQSLDTSIADTIRLAIAQCQADDYQPTHVVIHPLDWADYEIEKGSDGHYITVSMPSDSGVLRTWSLKVVPTTAVNRYDVFVGDFARACHLAFNEQATIALSTEGDFFRRNQVGIRVELSCAFGVDYPGAFCKVDITPD